MSTPTWGGARTPSNPAVVSGPGAHSARTDGGVMDPSSPAYGEGVELGNLQSAAPMAASAGASGAGGVAPGGAAPLVGLGEPGQAGLPVTAGADAGAGPGFDALGIPTSPADEDRADVRGLPEGMLAAMVTAAGRPDASLAFKRLVRKALAYR